MHLYWDGLLVKKVLVRVMVVELRRCICSTLFWPGILACMIAPLRCDRLDYDSRLVYPSVLINSRICIMDNDELLQRSHVHSTVLEVSEE